jgi:hypothetical protein
MRGVVVAWMSVVSLAGAACGSVPLRSEDGGSGGAAAASAGDASSAGGAGGAGGAAVTNGTGGTVDARVASDGPVGSVPDATATGAGGSSGGILLLPDSKGFIDGTNAAGVIGSWYAFADGYGDGASVVGAGPCQLAGHTDCSYFNTPVPNTPFAPDPQGAMCAAGHAAMVPLMGTTFDYTNVYGAEITLDFNVPPPRNGGPAVKQPYDAIDRTPSIRGIAFDIDTPPANAMRVELPTSAVPGTTDANAAYWGGRSTNASPVLAGHNAFFWTDVGGPMSSFLSPPAFDPTKLLSLRFHVITNGAAAFSFNFCISNLTLLTN